MPLKLDVIAQAIYEMAQAFDGEERRDRLPLALERLRVTDPAHVRVRLDDPQARPDWLVAYPERTFTARYPLPHCPKDFTVVAADGSYIAPDRHSPVRFFIINTGYAVLTYGDEPQAELDAITQLYYRDEEVFLSPDYRTLPIEGALLALKVAVDEMVALLHAITAVRRKMVALRDGTLILWGLDSPGIDEEVRRHFLEPYQRALRRLRDLEVPLVAYTSYPGADDVINALRVGLCPDPSVVCRQCQAVTVHKRRPRCAPLAMLLDRLLFAHYLADGERSDYFRSRHPVLKYFDQDQQVCFFYLNVGGEIARLEVPAWVAKSPELLDRVHAVVYDQCQRGHGYPPALTEAHEQAVITAGERRLVEEMVARELAGREILYARSEKDRSKRVRGV